MFARFWVVIPVGALVIGVVLGGIVLTRRSGEDDEAIRSGPIRLVYWGLTEPTDAMETLIEEYEANNPNVRIDYRRQSREQYAERLLARLEQPGGSAPDLFQWHATWKPMMENVLAPAPPDIFDPNTVRGAFYSPVFDTVVRGQQVVGVPLMIDGLALLLNMDRIEDAGYTDPPSTWEEFREMARELTTYDEEGGIAIAGAAIGTSTNVDHWSDILGVMLLQSGVDPGDPRGVRAEEALSFYTLFVREDAVWDETMDPSLVAFANGRVAMAFTPSWRLPEIVRTSPRLRLRTAPIPQLTDSTTAWGSYWVEGVATTSPYQREAWAFLSFLSSVDSLYRLAGEHTKILGIGFPYPRPVMAASLRDDPLLAAYIQQAPIMESFPMAYGTKDHMLNDKVIAAYDTAVKAVLDGKDAGDALATAAEEIAAALDQE